jgi:uncharacterized protein (DUF2235 family)
MSKNIVICADGTGNTTIKGRGTNVFKLYEAVDGNGHRADPSLTQQVAIYHDGVGTESLKWLRIFSGATGWGLGRNVKQLYGELARVYDAGDRIFLFGFSRGAFTVRTLAGLINTFGILDVTQYSSNRAFRGGIHAAYAEYRRKYRTWFSRLLRGPRAPEADRVRKIHYITIPGFADAATSMIQFIGVWDTVDAVGLPLRLADVINALIWRFKFPDTTLSPRVGYACHALAIDEARQSFAPVLWNESSEAPASPPRIEQVWFAGAHSNVGGGYPRQGMSLTALDWMMTRAEARGLRFHAALRELYRGGADVNDKRYDSRAGLGVFYRWKPRDVQQLCQRCGVEPKIHRSVFERVARNTEGYAPGSLPVSCRVVSTTAPSVVRGSIELTIEEAFRPGPPLLRRARGWHVVGRFGSMVLILATVALIVLILVRYVRDSWPAGGGIGSVAGGLAANGLSSHWLTIAVTTAWHYPWVVGAAAAGMGLVIWAERRLDTFYSAFWHRIRDTLRAAM